MVLIVIKSISFFTKHGKEIETSIQFKIKACMSISSSPVETTA